MGIDGAVFLKFATLVELSSLSAGSMVDSNRIGEMN